MRTASQVKCKTVKKRYQEGFSNKDRASDIKKQKEDAEFFLSHREPWEEIKVKK